ncbi:DUF6924 domain-containing protein [Streptomyces sp. CoH17]|uniref:DUF6924 domain-containing protein n=1 Tax=Streptomyces sp. CoH17 TaxID=2992806 RepID=UPI002271CD16|nr:hypothetical protein [Streptomyces sp. CoH17]
MKKLPQTKDVLLIRTDFTEGDAWGVLQAVLAAPGFHPRLHIVDDSAYRNLGPLKASSLAPTSNFLLLADKATLSTPDLQLLAIFPSQRKSDGIRVAAEEVWTVENSIFQANILWGIY